MMRSLWLAFALCCHCARPATESSRGNEGQPPNLTPEAAATYGYGPPWGEVWCVKHSVVDSEWLIGKYAQPGDELRINDRACVTSLRMHGKARDAGYTIQCGDINYGNQSFFAKATSDSLLGVKTYVQEQETSILVQAWKADIPCEVWTRWSKQSPEVNRSQAYALAKDLLAQLTPESIKRPRVDLVVTAEDKTGDKARAALARFRDRASTVQHYAPLAPGFPKVIKSDDYPELEPGNTYLLFGICPGGSGKQMAGSLNAALPPPYETIGIDLLMSTLTVDGLGLPRACPEAMNPSPLGGWTDFWKLDNDRVVGIALVDAVHMTTPGKPRLKGAAFLYTKDDQLLDTLLIEEPFPLTERIEGRYGTMIDVSYEDCRVVMQPTGRPHFSFGCYVDRGDQECSEKPFWGKSYKLNVTDNDKIRVESSSHTSSGGVCRPKSEFTVNPY